MHFYAPSRRALTHYNTRLSCRLLSSTSSWLAERRRRLLYTRNSPRRARAPPRSSASHAGLPSSCMFCGLCTLSTLNWSPKLEGCGLKSRLLHDHSDGGTRGSTAKVDVPESTLAHSAEMQVASSARLRTGEHAVVRRLQSPAPFSSFELSRSGAAAKCAPVRQLSRAQRHLTASSAGFLAVWLRLLSKPFSATSAASFLDSADVQQLRCALRRAS